MGYRPLFVADVKDGVLSIRNKLGFKTHLQTLQGEVYVDVGPRRKSRSNNQNEYYWHVVIGTISNSTGASPEDVHEFLKGRYLRKILYVNKIGTEQLLEMETVRSTTTLSTKEFEDYLRNCRQWASEALGIYVPQPNEVVKE